MKTLQMHWHHWLSTQLTLWLTSSWGGLFHLLFSALEASCISTTVTVTITVDMENGPISPLTFSHCANPINASQCSRLLTWKACRFVSSRGQNSSFESQRHFDVQTHAPGTRRPHESCRGRAWTALRHAPNFRVWGLPSGIQLLVFGDCVDRGKQSIECTVLVLACKIKHPENFFCIRGNHKCAAINRIYGLFYDECKRRCSIKPWKQFFLSCFILQKVLIFCWVKNWAVMRVLFNLTMHCLTESRSNALIVHTEVRAAKNISWATKHEIWLPAFKCCNFHCSNVLRNVIWKKTKVCFRLSGFLPSIFLSPTKQWHLTTTAHTAATIMIIVGFAVQWMNDARSIDNKSSIIENRLSGLVFHKRMFLFDTLISWIDSSRVRVVVKRTWLVNWFFLAFTSKGALNDLYKNDGKFINEVSWVIFVGRQKNWIEGTLNKFVKSSPFHETTKKQPVASSNSTKKLCNSNAKYRRQNMHLRRTTSI